MMKEFNKGTATINGEAFPVINHRIRTEEGIIAVTAGTTGLKGGDRDAGGRAYLAIESCPEFDMHADLKRDEDGNAVGVELALCGDEALTGLITALHEAVKILVMQTMEDED